MQEAWLILNLFIGENNKIQFVQPIKQLQTINKHSVHSVKVFPSEVSRKEFVLHMLKWPWGIQICHNFSEKIKTTLSFRSLHFREVAWIYKTACINIFRILKMTVGTKWNVVLIYIARISLRLQVAEKRGGSTMCPPRSWHM